MGRKAVRGRGVGGARGACTERLKKVIGAVVQSDQTYGVPGRSVSLNLALVRGIISWAEQRQLPLAILSLDQEKAFDRSAIPFWRQL